MQKGLGTALGLQSGPIQILHLKGFRHTMKLEDKHFVFPEDLAPAEVIRRINAVLSNPSAANNDVWLDQRMDWANAIYWMADEYWINPIWLLVSIQRERSLLGKHGEAHDFDFAQGYVGQHSPGTKNESWNGLPSQLLLSARGSSWSMGLRPAASFQRGGNTGKLPSWERFGPNAEVTLLSDATYKSVGKYKPKTMAEYTQIVFTPTERYLELLEINGSIFEKWIAPFWC